MTWAAGGALAAAGLAAAGLAWALRRWPYGTCPWCAGTGLAGRCRFCAGTGRRLRPGARLADRIGRRRVLPAMTEPSRPAAVLRDASRTAAADASARTSADASPPGPLDGPEKDR